MAYVTAGFDPAAFWRLTPRLYDLHMRGALARVEAETEAQNRRVYNIAALTGAAFRGKLPAFDRVFRPALTPGAPQSPDVLEANIRALARAWGAC